MSSLSSSVQAREILHVVREDADTEHTLRFDNLDDLREFQRESHVEGAHAQEFDQREDEAFLLEIFVVLALIYLVHVGCKAIFTE